MAQRPRAQRTGAQQLTYGIGLAALGVVLTIAAQFISSLTGSSYSVVFTGLIIIGVVYAAIGLFRIVTKR